MVWVQPSGETMSIIEWLRLPETKNITDLDDPATTILHGQIIQRKPLLRKLYVDFYHIWAKTVGDFEGKTLVEIGSGGGFVKEIIPNVITSDVLQLPNVDKVFSATDMPFDDGSVDAFFMLDVLHHLEEPQLFLREAARCLKNTGKIIMIEPANTPWSRFIYKNFHHELFDPQAQWESQEGGPLSDANGALPWIMFTRDRQRFETDFPFLKIVRTDLHTPLRYLISGGLSIRALLPGFCYRLVRGIEYLLSPCKKWLSMFQTIELEKIG